MRVLIVDDSSTIRWDVHQILAAEGFSSELAGDVSAARHALYSMGPFDLIVLDVRLPDQDGVDFLREIRADERTANVPVILLSAEAEVPDRIRGLKGGANEYVGKPYDRGYVAARARALAGMASSTRSERSGTTVLVIDDSASMRAKLRLALENAGYGVIAASSGEEGLQLALTFRPDALVIDGMLPGIDGRTVVQRLRMDGALRRTPCLLLTSSSRPEDERLALEAGADDFVQKSGDPAVMLARLATLLRGPVAPAEGHGPSPMEPKKVLAIDDSPMFLAVLTEKLTEEGYAVVVARTGEEAVQVLRVERVDCILLDLGLGAGLGGEELCRRIRDIPWCKDLPLLVLTAEDQPNMMVKMLTAGADDYIIKSNDLDVLKVRMQARFRRHAVEEETRRLRDQQVRQEMVGAQMRASQELAETRGALLAELEKKNKELAKARDAALQENQFKTKFLSSMSHELRTPLNAIVGFSELLDQGIGAPLHPKQAQYVSQVVSSSRHLLALVNDILDISRIESGRMTLQREWTPLGLISETIQTALGPVSQQRGIALDIVVPATVPDVYLDPVRFRQVLYNLVWNAFKFTPSGGKVKLTADVDDQFLTVRVEDTGIGIPQEEMHRLFIEFEQLEFHSGREPEGTGLGLALTKRLVEMHEGEITADSVVGQGTSFTVKLPLRRPNEDGSPMVADGLSRRLRDVMVRADRDSRQVTLVVAKMARAAAVANEPWQRALLPHLGPDDFVTEAGEGTLALVAVEVAPRAAAERQAWFLELLKSAMRMEVAESRAAAFPLDARKAEDLLARCLPPAPRVTP